MIKCSLKHNLICGVAFLFLFGFAQGAFAKPPPKPQYSAEDKELLRQFLRKPSAEPKKTNAQIFRLTKRDTTNWEVSENWIDKIGGVHWSDSVPFQMVKIEWLDKKKAEQLKVANYESLIVAMEHYQEYLKRKKEGKYDFRMFEILNNDRYVGVQVGGGYQSLLYNVNAASKSNSGYGFNIGFFYKIRFKKSPFFLLTGLDFDYYQTTLKMNNYQEKSLHVTPNGFDFDFIVDYHSYQEKSGIFFVNVPLMLNFERGKLYQIAWNVAAGLKVKIPIYAKYSGDGTLSTSGYIPSLNTTIRNIPELGFEDNFSMSSDGKFELKPVIAASFQCGFFVPRYFENKLYVGVYFDYGLNNLQKNQELMIVYAQTEPANFEYGSVAQAASKLSLIVLGLNLKLRF